MTYHGDTVHPAVPYSKADELASACLQDDPEAYYRVFEFDELRFPDLLPGERVRVEFRRMRPPTWKHPLTFTGELVGDTVISGVTV